MLFFYYYFQMHKYKQINNESLVTGLLTRSFLFHVGYQDRTLERKKGQNKEKINKEKKGRRKANE